MAIAVIVHLTKIYVRPNVCWIAQEPECLPESRCEEQDSSLVVHSIIATACHCSSGPIQIRPNVCWIAQEPECLLESRCEDQDCSLMVHSIMAIAVIVAAHLTKIYVRPNVCWIAQEPECLLESRCEEQDSSLVVHSIIATACHCSSGPIQIRPNVCWIAQEPESLLESRCEEQDCSLMVHSIMAKSAHNTKKTNDVQTTWWIARLKKSTMNWRLSCFSNSTPFGKQDTPVIDLLLALPSIRSRVQLNTTWRYGRKPSFWS